MTAYKSTIPIAFATDDHYCLYTCVAIRSIIQNGSLDYFFRFIVLVPSNFTQGSRQLAEKSIEGNTNCSIEFVDAKGLFDNSYIQMKHITNVTYYRLILPSVLQDVDKCLYLDGDIVVCGDLSELYQMEIGDNYIAGVKAPWYVLYANAKEYCGATGLPSMERYVNAGVLLMNLDAIRKDGIDKKFIALSSRKFESQDQDIINIACYDGIYHIPLRFNAMSKFMEWSFDRLKGVFTEEEVEAAWRDPLIIHYANPEKPWQAKPVPLAERWWMALERSPMATNFYKVSIVIPVFNAGEFLKKCLDSVINQTLKEIEILCVDDGSTDKSAEILEQYRVLDKRIKIFHQENSGAGVARNKALYNAKGRYIAFMDPDDWYPETDILETLYNKAVSNGVKICGGSMSKCRNGKITTGFHDVTFYKEGLIDYSDYQFDFGYTRFIYERKLLEDNHISFPHYRRFQDPPFFVKAMVCAGQFYAVEKVTYCHRLNYKVIRWNSERTNGLIRGLNELLEISSLHKMSKLHKLTVERLHDFAAENKFAENITLDNLEMLALLLLTNKLIDPSLLGESSAKYEYNGKIIIAPLKDFFLKRQKKEEVSAFKRKAFSLLTFVPRGINRFTKCWRSHGLLYTIKYLFISAPARLRSKIEVKNTK